LLCEGKVESVTDLRAKKKRMFEVILERPVASFLSHTEFSQHLPKKYLVIDNPARLQAKDWDRVVAVVAEGKEWQFKDWPPGWKTPQEIFAKAKGFFFCFSDEVVPDQVTKWNVSVFQVSRHNRQKDVALQMDMWRCVDEKILHFII